MSGRYMFVTYYQKSTGKWDEVTEFRNSLTKSVLAKSRLVLDLRYKECVKNTVNPEMGFYDFLEYYKKELGEELVSQLPEDLRISVDR